MAFCASTITLLIINWINLKVPNCANNNDNNIDFMQKKKKTDKMIRKYLTNNDLI